MKLKMKQFCSLRAALSLALLAAAAGSVQAAEVAATVGGDVISGDQATLQLDATVPGAFSLSKAGATPSVRAYFNAHLFCAQMPGIDNALVLQPRWQQPVSVGNDVWQFPSVSVQNLVYQGSGYQNAGAPALRIGEAANPALKRFRCLSAHAGSSLEPWEVSHGTFDSDYGDYFGPAFAAPNTLPPQDPPSDPHQNVKVVAETFGGFAGKTVSVVRVEMQFDGILPASTEWTLIDAFNTAALSTRNDANWCLLRGDWVEGTTPPPLLCNDATVLMPGFGPESGPFVERPLGFSVVTPGPYYVLVARENATSTPSAGAAIQGFAALRTAGGMVGVADELQDWYADDSVWYNY